MSDRENFISAILAEPNDDVNRLAFADWLDDNGEGERDHATAEFIRLSCRMEQWVHTAGHPGSVDTSPSRGSCAARR